MAHFNQDTQFGAGSAQKAGQAQCSQCEAMLADVLDGTLTAEEQAQFDRHIATCAACSQMLADAQRGAAWLELLRTPRPEPPPALLERILAQTSAHAFVPEPVAVPGISAMPSEAPFDGVAPRMGTVLPFRGRLNAVRRGSLGQVMLQPRLAMTAAMAFFSIGLTLSLTGVRLNELRPSDLTPSNIRRSLYQADAHLVRYYDNLRVVYELESRVRELQRATEGDTQGAPTPENDPGAKPAGDTKAPEQKQARPAGAGTSRRQSQDGLRETRSLVAFDFGGREFPTQPATPHWGQDACTGHHCSAQEGERA